MSTVPIEGVVRRSSGEQLYDCYDWM